MPYAIHSITVDWTSPRLPTLQDPLAHPPSYRNQLCPHIAALDSDYDEVCGEADHA
jgi:hypothetical protein